MERFRAKQGRKDFFYPKNARSLRGDITREPLVTAAEIGALDPLDGYLQHGNLIVRMRFPRVVPVETAERFVERKRAATAPPAKPAAQPAPASVQQQQKGVAVEAAPSRKPQEGDRHPFFE